MDDIIHISWGTGHYDLSVDVFFPRTMTDTRQLFRVIVGESDWTQHDIDSLCDYFEERRSKAMRSAEQSGIRGQKKLLKEAEYFRRARGLLTKMWRQANETKQ